MMGKLVGLVRVDCGRILSRMSDIGMLRLRPISFSREYSSRAVSHRVATCLYFLLQRSVVQDYLDDAGDFRLTIVHVLVYP